jgi:DNA-binding Lrp family transcriptional regulator
MLETFQFDKIKTVTRAYLMINCESGSEACVFDNLKKIPEIKKAEAIIGRHDILALIHADSPDELGQIITTKIRKVPQIRCTTTLVCAAPGA